MYLNYFQFIIIKELNKKNVDLWIEKETFLHRDTGVTEYSTVLYTLFYLISIYINSCKDQLSKFQVFWKFCWGSLKSFQHCGQIFIFHWNLFQKRKPLYSWQFFLNVHSFFPQNLTFFWEWKIVPWAQQVFGIDIHDFLLTLVGCC